MGDINMNRVYEHLGLQSVLTPDDRRIYFLKKSPWDQKPRLHDILGGSLHRVVKLLSTNWTLRVRFYIKSCQPTNAKKFECKFSEFPVKKLCRN